MERRERRHRGGIARPYMCDARTRPAREDAATPAAPGSGGTRPSAGGNVRTRALKRGGAGFQQGVVLTVGQRMGGFGEEGERKTET